MMELLDHLNLAQIAFGCDSARKFCFATRIAVQLKGGTVTVCYQ